MDQQLRRRAVGAPAARSTLLTILGEYVLPHSTGVWQETLVTAMQTMGYKPQTARQAVTRSVKAGWLQSEKAGRASRLQLTARCRSMLRDGARRIYSFGTPREPSDQWLLLLVRVPERTREVRHRLRTRLSWAGCGSLGNGVWITPHIERERELSAIAQSERAAEIMSFRVQPTTISNAHSVILQAWELDTVASAYRAFTSRFQSVDPVAPADVFRAHTQLVHAWRKFPYLDPELPADMLPARWPQQHARELFEQRRTAWHAIAESYFRQAEEQPRVTRVTARSGSSQR